MQIVKGGLIIEGGVMLSEYGTYVLACTHTHTHTHTHARIYTCIHMYIHTLAPRSIAAEMVGVEVSADPLSVNFSVEHVSSGYIKAFHTYLYLLFCIQCSHAVISRPGGMYLIYSYEPKGTSCPRGSDCK